MKTSHRGKQPSPSHEVAVKARPRANKKMRETNHTAPRRPPSCRIRRRSTAATSHIIRQGESTELGPLAGCLAVTTMKHNARGPRHIRSWTPPRARCLTEDTACGGLTTSQIRLLCHHQDDEQCCPILKIPIKQSNHAPLGQQHLVGPPMHTASAAIPARQVVACAIFQRCTAPESRSKAEQPAAALCKPSHPTMSLLQASSSDVVPRHTDSYRAMPATALRCKQPKLTPMRQPLATSITLVATMWVRQPPSIQPPAPAALLCHRQKSPMTNGDTGNATGRDGSLPTMLPRR
jgi:hypothetical protein